MTFRSYLFSLLLISTAVLPTLHTMMAHASMGEAEEANNKDILQKEKDERLKLQSKETSPILLSADSIDYNQETDMVIATGNVEIGQGDRLLHAQKVIYNRKTGMMTAAGNVCLKEKEKVKIAPNPDASTRKEFLNHQDLIINNLKGSSTLMSNPLNLPELGKQLPNTLTEEEDGEIVSDYNLSFSPYAEFSNKFQDGFITEAKMLMSDNARLAANSAKRVGGRKVIFRQAVYSPCRVCRLDPTKQPLWQLKADKVIHSKTDQMIIYHHARLEISGIPVFYLPYFRHADPTVKRKTGFLMPTYAAISDLGTIISTPFYYAIAPNRDLTLVPIITTKQGPVMVAEYRHRFRDGDITGTASYTQTHDLKKIPKVLGLREAIAGISSLKDGLI